MASARLSTTCPGCGKRLSYSADKVGRRGRCPCGVTIELRAELRQATQVQSEPAAEAAPRDRVGPVAPVPANVVLRSQEGRRSDLLESYNWMWYRVQAVFLCSISILALLLGFAYLSAPPEHRSVPTGILTMLGSIIPFVGGIWLWRRRKRDN